MSFTEITSWWVASTECSAKSFWYICLALIWYCLKRTKSLGSSEKTTFLILWGDCGIIFEFRPCSMHKVNSLFFDCSLASLLASAMLRESFDLRTSFCAFYLSASICSTAFLFSFCSLSRNMSSETLANAMSALAFRTSWSLIERLSLLFFSAALWNCESNFPDLVVYGDVSELLICKDLRERPHVSFPKDSSSFFVLIFVKFMARLVLYSSVPWLFH